MPCITAPKVTEQKVIVEPVEKIEAKELPDETKKEATGESIEGQGPDVVDIDTEL